MNHKVNHQNKPVPKNEKLEDQIPLVEGETHSACTIEFPRKMESDSPASLNHGEAESFAEVRETEEATENDKSPMDPEVIRKLDSFFETIQVLQLRYEEIRARNFTKVPDSRTTFAEAVGTFVDKPTLSETEGKCLQRLLRLAMVDFKDGSQPAPETVKMAALRPGSDPFLYDHTGKKTKFHLWLSSRRHRLKKDFVYDRFVRIEDDNWQLKRTQQILPENQYYIWVEN